MPPMNRIDFCQTQLPVGQGGFHMGWLIDSYGFACGPSPSSDTQFIWAYDCGSDQRSALESQIKLFEGIRINKLFLSHLDDDHVAGVDKLLLVTDEVEEVVLPYLNDAE